MTEETESIRRDSSIRSIRQMEVTDWSGKRVVLPRGTTLPSVARPSEVYVKVNDSGTDKLCIFDGNLDHWVTVGPSV